MLSCVIPCFLPAGTFTSTTKVSRTKTCSTCRTLWMELPLYSLTPINCLKTARWRWRVSQTVGEPVETSVLNHSPSSPFPSLPSGPSLGGVWILCVRSEQQRFWLGDGEFHEGGRSHSAARCAGEGEVQLLGLDSRCQGHLLQLLPAAGRQKWRWAGFPRAHSEPHAPSTQQQRLSCTPSTNAFKPRFAMLSLKAQRPPATSIRSSSTTSSAPSSQKTSWLPSSPNIPSGTAQ